MSIEPLTPLSSGALFSALCEEISLQNWNLPVQSSLVELGLAWHSHLGLKRRRNEDRLAIARVRATNDEIYTLAVVCDGVGGSESGDQAATLAITSMIAELCTQRIRVSVETIAQHLLRTADSQVRSALNGRGTTTASLFIAASTGQCAAANVGDSRVYSWSPERQLQQVSVDDTVENELKLIPGDHEALLNARGLKGRLSQAIGEEGRSVEDLRIHVFSRKDFPVGVLLGSDGLWKASRDFETVVTNSANANDVVRRTVALANWNGGIDNASVIAIEGVEKFCGLPSLHDAKSNLISATVWLGHSTLKFIMERSAAPAKKRAGEAPRRAGNKRKATIATRPESQLSLPESSEKVNEDHPTIEISVDKKSV